MLPSDENVLITRMDSKTELFVIEDIGIGYQVCIRGRTDITVVVFDDPSPGK